jgi:hypothetical protein
MPEEIDPTKVTAPESIDVRVMRDGEWVHVGQAEYLGDGSISVTMDDTEDGAKITRHLNGGYINSYSIYQAAGENSNG